MFESIQEGKFGLVSEDDLIAEPLGLATLENVDFGQVWLLRAIMSATATFSNVAVSTAFNNDAATSCVSLALGSWIHMLLRILVSAGLLSSPLGEVNFSISTVLKKN